MELEKCGNYRDEIRKAEELIEEMRVERDEVRSTLSKIPTCVICLDNRVCASSSSQYHKSHDSSHELEELFGSVRHRKHVQS